ncbi:MAG TPA: ATP-binding protein [Solirubrobacteraceae bacterium]|nr:ATP-binding protein [Solirubrobacteraceae bacterium]
MPHSRHARLTSFGLVGAGCVRRALAATGLRWRLAAWVALVVLICMAITFVAVYRGTGTQLRHQIDREIAGDASEFSHTLAASKAGSPRRVAQAASRYVLAQPFTAGSTLLFAVVPGEGTRTNQPELFAQATPDNGETPATQTHENRLSAQLVQAHNGYSTLHLPDVGGLRLLKRTVRISGGLRVTVGVGEPLLAVRHAQNGVARAFILAGILALGGALIAAYLIGTRVSRPLRRMAAVASQVDAGDLHPRIHDVDGQGGEVRVLADAFNHMLDRLTEAFAGQRAFVADASHELRTPLTVIGGQVEVLAAQAHPSGEEVRRVARLVQSEIARTSRLVDDMLLLAKAEQTEFLHLEPIDLPAYIGELWDGIGLLADRRFELGPVPAGTFRADPDRLTQALRNLLSNAIAHTAPGDGLVRLSVKHRGQGRVLFVVEDDGPGIPVEERERVFDRFHRTDAARDRASGGSGLGLAIVRAIADAHEGRVAVGHRAGRGTRIEVELPHFTAWRHLPAKRLASGKLAAETDIEGPSSPGSPQQILRAQ